MEAIFHEKPMKTKSSGTISLHNNIMTVVNPQKIPENAKIIKLTNANLINSNKSIQNSSKVTSM